jgi:DNA-binding XRE family transcriptional regulator
MAQREHLRQARKARRLTQAELAERIGVATSTIGRIEAGDLDPSVSNALAIARVLRRSVEHLFGEEVAA